MKGYGKHFDEIKHTYFLIKDYELLKKYNKIWDKVSNIIKKEFDRKQVYSEKNLKSTIKSYYNKILSKAKSIQIFIMEYLKKVLIDSAFKTGKK